MTSLDSHTVCRNRESAWLPSRRTLFVASGICVAGFLIAGVGIPIARQRLAVQRIEKFNGSAQFHPCAPDWFYALIGRHEMEWIDKPWHVVFLPNAELIQRRSRFGGMSTETNCPMIDDENLSCVLGLPSLESLDLAFSNISDAGMKHVSQLQHLKELRLEGTDVSDESLPVLSKMRSLKELNVRDTKISLQGGRKLEAALPGCSVKAAHNDEWTLGIRAR